MNDTLTNEWDLKESRKPKFTEDATAQTLQLPEAFGQKPAITFFQKISLFSHVIDFINPVKGKLRMKGHSFLYEVDYKTGRIRHDFAFAKEVDLAWKVYRGNIKRFLLIDNVTDKIIWTYYGVADRYPYDVKFVPYMGSTVLSQYNYYTWKDERYENVNIMRDYVGALQEKIELNMSYHKQQWQDTAKKQVAREMKSAIKESKETSGGAVELHNQKRVAAFIETVHSKMNINK